MGFRFRKSFKVLPGVRVNVTGKGVSSVSVGGKGARVNIGKKRNTITTGLPGTGISYSQSYPRNQQAGRTGQNKTTPIWVWILVIFIGAVLMTIFFG